MTEFEQNTIAEIKARLKAGQFIAAWEKQLVLDVIRRMDGVMHPAVLEAARAEGFNVSGIKTA